MPPNIVFILVDNIGWGSFGVYGGVTPTPRIDKMASEGIRFNNYNVEAQCTPTRSAILTHRLSESAKTISHAAKSNRREARRSQLMAERFIAMSTGI